jgi:hypothetical protein
MFYVPAATLVVLVVLGFALVYRRERQQRFGFVNFGKADSATPQSRDRLLILFNQYAKQQRNAFALLWFAVAAGLVLAMSLLVAAMFYDRTTNVDVIAQGVALCTDGGLAAAAFSLYKTASQRLERVARELA